MEPKAVRALPELVVRHKARPIVRRAHRAVVDAHTLRKRARAPSLHPRHQDRHDVNAASLQRAIAADLLIAGAAEELTGAGHVFRTAERIVVGGPVLTEGTAG